jgi:hypothetical protein
VLLEGIVTRLDELVVEMSALRERVTSLEENLAKVTTQTVVGAKQAVTTPATSSASAPKSSTK